MRGKYLSRRALMNQRVTLARVVKSGWMGLAPFVLAERAALEAQPRPPFVRPECAALEAQPRQERYGVSLQAGRIGASQDG